MLQTVQKQQRFADLKQKIWAEAESHLTGRLDLDIAVLQDATSGGLALGRMHLVSGGPQDGAATGFTTAILRKLLQQNPDKALVWCLPAAPRTGIPFGDGLAALGLDPARIIFVCESHPLRAVAASEEALSADGVAAVICEYGPLAEKPDLWLKSARRMQLAAEEGQTTGIMLGPPTAAAGFETRWHITPSQNPFQRSASIQKGRQISGHISGHISGQISGQNSGSFSGQASWQPCWQAELIYCRGGRPAEVRLCWDIQTGRFRLPQLQSGKPLYQKPNYQAGPVRPERLFRHLEQTG